MLPIKAGISLRRERWGSGWSEKDMSLLPSAEVKNLLNSIFFVWVTLIVLRKVLPLSDNVDIYM